MAEIIPVVLWIWVVYTLWVFRRTPGPVAATIALLGGWLLLPNARYPESTAQFDFPYWIMPIGLPSPAWDTKARLIGVGSLLGLLLFDRKSVRGFRPVACDFAMVCWCLVPVLSGSANGLLPGESLANAMYQTLAWGVPYLLGRLYFANPAGAGVLARGVIVAGLIYVPFCLIESVTGPRLYATAYGFHAYEIPGEVRYVGFRPVVFLEDGNQLGIWMASAALTAAWLWWSGQLPRLGPVRGRTVAALLVGTAVWTQSAGAVILLAVGFLGLAGLQKVNRVWPVAVVLGLVLGLVGARAANLIDVKALAERSSLVRRFADVTVKMDRRSLGWRLSLEQRTTRLALERPWLGRGRWDWWRSAGERPWGLLTLVLGSNGLVGLAALGGVFVLPLVHVLRLGPPRLWGSSAMAPVAALAGVLVVNELDAILNPCYLTFLMAASGGLAGFSLTGASQP